MSHQSFGSVSFFGRTGRNVGTRKSLFLIALACLALNTCVSVFALTPTTTTLAVTSAGSPVTTVPALTIVTLTATVEAGTTPLTVGQVNFCDATATYCTDIHVLGTAQLTSAGTATLNFRPGTGSHSYKAVFLGTKTYASSFSGDCALTVGRKTATTTAITQGGTFGSYSLTATVTGLLNSPLIDSPTGTVSFLDTSNGNAVLGMANLGAGTATIDWLHSQTLPMGLVPFSIAVGDFNGDGILDLAEADRVANTVTIMLGNGDGTFTVKTTLATGASPGAIVAGDFNGDGVLDLAVSNVCGIEPNCNTGTVIGTVTVLLGNGDGTFTATTDSPETGYWPWWGSMVVGDFNGDGILDLAVANHSGNQPSVNPVAGSITVLLGHGDGTFTAAANSPVNFLWPQGIAAGDFNGDGILDLAIGNWLGGTTIMQGNGDGTFTTVSTTSNTGFWPDSAAVGDFTGDGILDIAVSSEYFNQVTILIGKGDGTFSAGSTLALNSSPQVTVLGDFNGDGIADLAMPTSSGTVNIFLGNGDGTFSATAADPTVGSQPGFITTGDFNGDGISDVAVPVCYGPPSPAVAVLLTQMTQTATATATSASLPANTGTHQVLASYPGDSNYDSSVSGTTGLITTANVSLSATTMSFGNEPVGYSTNSQNSVLTNTGGAAITIGSIRLTGTNAASFVTSNTCGTSLAAGASCKVGVRFVPTTTVGASAAITLTSSISSTPQNIIALSGTGVDAGTASLTLSAPSLSFGSEPIGYSTDSQNVIVTNSSSTAVLYFKTITLSGPNAASFVTSNTCGGSVGGFLNRGASCEVGVRFVPAAPGPATATVTLTSTASNSPQTIALSGTGAPAPAAASLSLSAGTLAFGNQTVGTSTLAQDVVVTNTRTIAKLYFNSITLGGTNASSFVTSNTCGGSGNGFGASLYPGENCTIGVRFIPTAVGPLTATITVAENAPGSPQTITLTGTGQ